MESEWEGLTGKMTTSEGGIRALFLPSFANAEMASRAIEDVVSNPTYQGNQQLISQRDRYKIHLDRIAHPQGTSTDASGSSAIPRHR